MQTPLPTTATTNATNPIPAADVIFRSFNILTANISRYKPWPEFTGNDVFDCPDPLTMALPRARNNVYYFRINYSFVVVACGAFSLVGTMFSLLVVGTIFILWLLLYFYREDPLFLYDRHVSDEMVLLALVLSSVWSIWITGCFQILVFGLTFGMFICMAHAVLRNANGLFLDEDEAASRGLIASGPGNGPSRQVKG